MLRVMPQKSEKKHGWDANPPRDWGEEQARRIALEVKRLRGKRSAQWLSNRTKELGYEVTRSVISDLEIARRRYVTVSELIVLAAALDTAPITLLYPPPYGETVELVPDVMQPKIGAVEWFCSDSNAMKYHPGEGSSDFHARTWPLYAARVIDELEESQRSLLVSLAKEADPDSLLAQGIRRELEYIALRLEEFRKVDGG
ncbi:hypothetical protein A5633_11490 [Mycolicibacterium elephantis]|uniref:hypothetical protein n=1 Tax=Mycolicibacterium elephantis TaxID=81858 RepID=UPI0007EB73A5|nr:hypothetical protein [Mycolicibacterium elephantis]OBA85966.1 hypothetical protein A5633_11490 [Mycolicibacterium elephantis]